MAKFVIFTNASPNFDGDSIAINRDIVASVFELIQPDTNAQLQPRTVIYGVNNVDWQVKESYLEVLAALNAD
jgi:predicted transcriptional regulator